MSEPVTLGPDVRQDDGKVCPILPVGGRIVDVDVALA